MSNNVMSLIKIYSIHLCVLPKYTNSKLEDTVGQKNEPHILKKNGVK